MNRNQRNGAIQAHEGRASIVFERRLPFPVAEVWRAITDPAERALWFGPSTIDRMAGGRVAMTGEGPPAPADMRHITGNILVWDPPHVFEHEWRQALIGDTVVRYELESDGNGTLLRFTHSGLKISDAKGYLPGQHAYLDRMEAHLARDAMPRWSIRYAEAEAGYRDAI